MKIIGITGSSGAGKTTVSQILGKEENIEILDCDKIARSISVPNHMYLKTIKKELGKEIFFEDGNLNRKLLAEIIYTNNEKLEKLNSITFKYVVEEVLKKIEEIKKNKKIEIIVIDAPLLFESNLNKKCNYTICLIADKQTKIERICRRDNISKELAQKRLNIQKEDKYYTEKSDFIIYNNDTNSLKEKLNEILSKIRGI